MLPAAAAAPAAPVLTSPAAGATTTGTSVELRAEVKDDDGGRLDVRFEGRKVGAVVPGTGSGDPFSIAVLPDLQNYTYAGRQGTILQQAQWLVEHRASLGLAFVAQLGDLVSEYDNPLQWERTSSGLAPLDSADMPYSVVPGNHDHDRAVGAGVGPYDSYFPPSRFSGNTWSPSTATYGGFLGQNLFGPDPVDRRNMDNFALFTAGGTDFLVLNLEWEAPSFALDWGRKVLAAHPDRVAILVTHSFVNTQGERRTFAERPGGTSPAALWNTFVSQECSIRLVLSGHEHDNAEGEARRTDTNACGRPVPQILTDYQDRPNGGDGWLRYYTFDPASATMTATTYSPKLGQSETDANSAFTVPFDLAQPEPAPFQSIEVDTVESGGTATATWNNLEPDTAYEWRAIADDGSDTTGSGVRTFRTTPARVVAEDSFTRTLANTWGSTPTGQAWTLSGAATSWAVNAGTGRMTVNPGGSRTALLPAVAVQDVGVTGDLGISTTANGTAYPAVMARRLGADSYRARARILTGGAVQLQITRLLSGVETTLASTSVPGLAVRTGASVRVKLEASGTSPTMLRAKAWLPGATEPSTFQAATSDSSAPLQQAGGSGVTMYLSSSAPATTLNVDNVLVERLGGVAPPPNQPPTAAIGAPTVNGRDVSVSGAGSSDSDGSIVGYSWEFGDGGTATGVTASRTYAAAGTYTVRLTVTDDDGATATTSRQLTVTEPPAGELAADAFGRTVANGWGKADVGGSWAVLGSAARYSVAGGVGRHALTTAGATTDAALDGVSSAGIDLRTDMTWSRTAAAGTLYGYVTPRRINASNGYFLRIVVASNNRFRLDIVRRLSGAETTIGSTTLATLTHAANTEYSVAVRATMTGGVTTIRAKLWLAGAAEPGWSASATDSSAALQVAGSVALGSYMSGSATAPVTTSFDDLRAVGTAD